MYPNFACFNFFDTQLLHDPKFVRFISFMNQILSDAKQFIQRCKCSYIVCVKSISTQDPYQNPNPGTSYKVNKMYHTFFHTLQKGTLFLYECNFFESPINFYLFS